MNIVYSKKKETIGLREKKILFCYLNLFLYYLLMKKKTSKSFSYFLLSVPYLPTSKNDECSFENNIYISEKKKSYTKFTRFHCPLVQDTEQMRERETEKEFHSFGKKNSFFVCKFLLFLVRKIRGIFPKREKEGIQ